jgi:hypothetical protein
MEIKHCCADCGQVLAVHDHASYQEIKDCLAGMKPLCPECASWPGSTLDRGVKAALLALRILLLGASGVRAQSNTFSTINQLAGTASMLSGQVNSFAVQHQAMQRQRVLEQQQAARSLAQYCPPGWRHTDALLADQRSTVEVCVRD